MIKKELREIIARELRQQPRRQARAVPPPVLEALAGYGVHALPSMAHVRRAGDHVSSPVLDDWAGTAPEVKVPAGMRVEGDDTRPPGAWPRVLVDYALMKRCAYSVPGHGIVRLWRCEAYHRAETPDEPPPPEVSTGVL